MIVLSYTLVIIAIILTVFIYTSILFSKEIINWGMKAIKENRKEVIKIKLQDLSLSIQLSIGLGVALMLFSLSKTGVEVIAWLLFGLVSITLGIFLMFWKYLPLRNKIYKIYDK